MFDKKQRVKSDVVMVCLFARFSLPLAPEKCPYFIDFEWNDPFWSLNADYQVTASSK